MFSIYDGYTVYLWRWGCTTTAVILIIWSKVKSDINSFAFGYGKVFQSMPGVHSCYKGFHTECITRLMARISADHMGTPDVICVIFESTRSITHVLRGKCELSAMFIKSSTHLLQRPLTCRLSNILKHLRVCTIWLVLAHVHITRYRHGSRRARLECFHHVHTWLDWSIRMQGLIFKLKATGQLLYIFGQMLHI